MFRDSRKVHRFLPLGADFQRLLQCRHHAQPEQVHLHEPHVLAVALVPLQHGAAGHAGVFQRHVVVELARAEDHATRVLAEMPREAVQLEARIQQDRQARMIGRDPRHAQLLGQVEGLREISAVKQRGETIDHVIRQAEHLADAPHGAPTAETNDVRRHGRPAAAVAAIDFLDHLLAHVLARQVEVDVGPVGAALRQEPLEQELAGDGVDRGDAQRVADRAVGRAPAPLHEDAVVAGKTAEIPDDQEIPAETQLRDESEFPLQLPAHVAHHAAVALLGAEVRHLAQKTVLVLVRRHRVVRKPVAKVLEGERNAAGEDPRVDHGLGQVGKERLHLPRRFHVPLPIAREPASGGVEGDVLAQAGEYIGDGARLRGRVVHAVGREQRYAAPAGPVDHEVVGVLLVGQEVTLDLRIQASGSEGGQQAIRGAAGGGPPGAAPSLAHGAVGIASEGDEAGIVRREFGPGHAAFALGGAEVGDGQHCAQSLIAGARGDEDGHDGLVIEDDLAADQRADSGFLGGLMQAHRAVNAVAVAQGEGGQLTVPGCLREGLGRGAAAEEGEGAARMELDIGDQSSTPSTHQASARRTS